MDKSYRGLLLVHLQRGKNLISADINGLSDPYVSFRLGDVTVKSRVVEKSLNPLWNETINIIGDRIAEKKLICKVMDKDILTDDFLGEAVVDFSSLNNMEEKLFKVDLTQVKSGTITLYLRWIDISMDDNVLIDKYGYPALFENAAEAISKETTYDTSSPPGVGLIKTVGKTGIPYSHKTAFWQVFGLQVLSLPPSPYASLDYNSLLKLSPVPVVKHQIELDIPRTFPQHPAFNSPEMQKALTNVLNAYAVKNPGLGYCQSLNFIAGGLLLIMRESDAFLMLCFIVEHFFPEYWTQSMGGVQTDLVVIEHLLKKKIPKLAAHCASIGADIGLLTTSWIMGLFLTLVPFPTALRLWDFIFTRGSEAIILITYALILYLSDDLLKFSELSEVATHIHETCKKLYNWKDLVAVINGPDMPKIKEIRNLRHQAKVQVDERTKKRSIAELKKNQIRHG